MNMTPAMLRAALEGRNIDASPGGIMRSERAGQQELVASSDVPKEMFPDRAAFEKVGFKFGEDVDDIFISATLPPGWTRSATSHSMHSDVLDEKGRKRVSVFYKAAFYDRRASAYLVPRLQLQWLFHDKDTDNGVKEGELAYAVSDAGQEIFRTATFDERDLDADKVQRAVAEEWLKEAAPDHLDPTAYW